MDGLTLIKLDRGAFVDSRDVAKAIGKRHTDLLRDIGRYRKYMENSTERKIAFSDFFLEDLYFDGTGRELPCYLLSKMGCEMVANKLTGEKGVLFTAAYVSLFNEMERTERETQAAIPVHRLGEYNACARIIVCGLKWLGASPEQIMRFLKNTYEPLGISIDFELEKPNHPQQWYTASEIAENLGIYSLNGKPHAQAVSCILNENIFIGTEHKSEETDGIRDNGRIRTLYDEYAVEAVTDWLTDNAWPDEIYGFGRTFHVQYPLE